MLSHARTQHRTGKISADQQLDCTGIAVWGSGFHHRAYGFITFTGDKHAMVTLAQLRSLNDKTAFL
ncbi:hypothetical protein D3C78_1844950 [compost metagenome]